MLGDVITYALLLRQIDNLLSETWEGVVYQFCVIQRRCG